MSAKSFTRIVIVAVAVGFVFAGPARADKKQLQEKLNNNISIKLDDVTIAEALETIGQKAELKIVFSDEAVWKLPEGETTRLSVTLEGRLGESMTEMLTAFFMRYAVGDEEITIYPRQELEHVIGRPSTKQLELLKKIYSNRMQFHGASKDVLLELIERGFGGLSIVPYYVLSEMKEILAEITSEIGTTPLTLAILLEQVGRMKDMSYWYLSDVDTLNQIPMLTMVSEQDFRQAKLDQIIDVSFIDERADVILQRLAGWAGMVLRINTNDPSWLEKKIAVKMQDVTLQQALQSIVHTVDGTYEFSPRKQSVLVQGPIHRQKTAATPRKSKDSISAEDDYVGKISIPMDGGKYFIEFMLRQSDLPEELKNFREQMIKEVLGKYAQEAELKKNLIEALEDAKTEAASKPVPKPQK